MVVLQTNIFLVSTVYEMKISTDNGGVIMKTFKSIIIKYRKGKRVKVARNPTSFPLMGIGAQGAVFVISEDQCVKRALRT